MIVFVAMGNTISDTKALPPTNDDDYDDNDEFVEFVDALMVPDASMSSNSSSSSSSESSGTDTLLIDPYDTVQETVAEQQQQHHQQQEEEEQSSRCGRLLSYSSSVAKTMHVPNDDHDDKARNTTSSGCYRLPIFRRKADPLTVVVEGSPTTTQEEVKKTTSPYSCWSSTPRTESRQSRLSKASLSFSYCKYADSIDEEDDDYDLDFHPHFIEVAGGSLHSNNNNNNNNKSTSQESFKGCVSNPLSKSSSWASLFEESELLYTLDEENMIDGDEATPESDLSPLRRYWIVTTAALPWMTGTAVNPLLRAAYLSQRNRILRQQQQQHNDGTTNHETTVTLALPWLESAEDRVALYGSEWKDATPSDQETYVRNWLKVSAGLPLEADADRGGLRIQWYPGRYHAEMSSIFAMGDLCELIPPDSHEMICILEEPEHVNWYRPPGNEGWRQKFPHVIGIVHTNYKAYVRRHHQYTGLLTSPLLGTLSSILVRAYCDKIVKLSPVLQAFAPEKEVVSNVHGIRKEFFDAPLDDNANGIYFIGKLLWAKGLDKLLDLQACYKKHTGSYWEMDIFGSGADQDDIQRAYLGQEYDNREREQQRRRQQQEEDSASSVPTKQRLQFFRRFRQPIPARFMGRLDHASVGGRYKIFVNPSVTEVLCTTSAEAIAMGKWVILPKHSSNEFFLQFDNCLQYSNKTQFVKLLRYAVAHKPPRCPNGYPALTWQAATERLIETACLSKREKQRCERLQPNKDQVSQGIHYAVCQGRRGDFVRKILGAGSVAEQSMYKISESYSPNKTQSPPPSSPTTTLQQEESLPSIQPTDVLPVTV